MSRDKNTPKPARRSSRRRFLQAGLSAGAGAGMAAAIPAAPVAAADAQAAPPPAAPAEVAAFELDELSISDLSEGLRSGRFTARSLVEKYAARIEAVDRRGPTLRSVIELNPDAPAIAAALDKERADKGPRGPLHGIPVLIKDNIDTADKMATTAGSLALVGAKPPADAFLVSRLRRAGAVILGKTNLSEWANIRSTRSTSGWSGRGGLTRNPCALDRNPSGSSSGSAAAAAASLCAAAVGTETDGSIVSPASVCGIVGLKPTVGLISRTGVIPIAHSQDTAGPMTRTVRDAAILLGALAGTDREDTATADADAKAAADYTRFLDSKGLEGARIGVIRRFAGFHPGAVAVFNEAVEEMKRRGAVVVDPAEPPLPMFGAAEITVLLYELKADLNAYLARLGPDAPVKTLQDIIEFNERNREKEMPHFGQEHFLTAQAKGPLTDKEYLDALAACRRLSRAEGIDALMDRHKLDALTAPTTGPAAVTDLVYGNRSVGGTSGWAAVAGYPSITLPAGAVAGLPMGISYFGRAWSEPTLLKIAFAFEQATKARRPPRFAASVPASR